jgi:hypothetical protein
MTKRLHNDVGGDDGCMKVAIERKYSADVFEKNTVPIERNNNTTLTGKRLW